MSIRTTARDEAAGQINDILAGRSGQEQQLSEKHNPLVFEFEEHPTGCGSAPKSQIGKTNKISIPPQDSGLDMESGLWNQGYGIRDRSAIQSLEIQDLNSEAGILAWILDLDLGLAADDYKPRIIPLLFVIAGDDQKFAPLEGFPRMLEGLH